MKIVVLGLMLVFQMQALGSVCGQASNYAACQAMSFWYGCRWHSEPASCLAPTGSPKFNMCSYQKNKYACSYMGGGGWCSWKEGQSYCVDPK